MGGEFRSFVGAAPEVAEGKVRRTNHHEREPDMTNVPSLAQLQAFIAVAETLHFGRAATLLHTTQPPLSRSVQALEKSVGVSLLDRTSRQVSLTPAGEAVLVEARHLVARWERIVEKGRRAANGEGRALMVGCVETAAYGILPKVLADFRQEVPDVSLELFDLHSPQQLAGLKNLSLDLAILRAPVEDNAVDFEFAYHDYLVAALPEGHPLAQAEMELGELQGQDFILYDQKIGRGISTAFINACTAASFRPQIRHFTSSTPMLLALVAAGEGIGIVSGPVSLIPRPGVVFAEFRGRPARSTIAMAWRKGEDDPELSTLRGIIRRHGGDNRYLSAKA